MRTFASPLKNKATLTKSSGEVAEWSIAAVLKTVVPRGTRGSNPCLSAIKGVCEIYTLFYTQNKDECSFVLENVVTLLILQSHLENFSLDQVTQNL